MCLLLLAAQIRLKLKTDIMPYPHTVGSFDLKSSQCVIDILIIGLSVPMMGVVGSYLFSGDMIKNTKLQE